MTSKKQPRRSTQYPGVVWNGYSYAAVWRRADGRKKTQAGFATAAEADRFRGRMVAQARDEKVRRSHLTDYVGAADRLLTVDDLFELYLTSKAAAGKRRTATVDGDRMVYRARIGPVFGSRLVSSITVDDLVAWQADLVESLSGPYARRVRSMLNQLFRLARRRGAIAVNPFEDDVPMIAARADRTASRKQKAIPPAKLDELIAAADDRYRAMLHVWREGGLRPSEAYGLRLDDFAVDEDNGVVWVAIRRSVTTVRSAPVLNDFTKTEASRRTIPLPSWVAEELADHVERYGLGADGLLFRSPDGGLVNNANFTRRVLRPAAKAVGLLDDPSFGSVVAYSIRHSAATDLYHRGHPLAEVAKRMGHSTRVAAQHYSHVAAGGDLALVSTDRQRVVRILDAESGATVHDLAAKRLKKLATS
jgi:integrase